MTVEENVEQAVISQLAGIGTATPEAQSEGVEHEEGSFEFSNDFQQKIAALSIQDSQFARRTEGLIKPEYFDSEYRAVLVAIAQEHFTKYRSLPSRSAWVELLKDAIKSRRVRDDTRSFVVNELKSLLGTDLSDGNYVVDKVSEFAKNRAVQRAMLESFDLIEKGNMGEAQKIMEKAFSVGAADAFKDYDYWNDIERRTQYRKDKAAGLIKPNGIPTGIKEIDRLLYHKGWGRQELSVLMAPAKRGKSMALGEFAARASMLGYNALYVTLEVSSEIIMDRLDANISSTDMDELENQMNTVEGKIKTRRQQSPGKLRVTQFASGGLTPNGLRRLLERYRADGIIFDVIVIDYADIMGPDIQMRDNIENSKQVWLGLRAIAFEENAALLTATQTNREGFKASVATADKVAEDFNKIRIADLVISINRDEAETLAGEARLFFAASRNQAGEFTLKITQDLGKMRFIKSVSGMSS